MRTPRRCLTRLAAHRMPRPYVQMDKSKRARSRIQKATPLDVEFLVSAGQEIGLEIGLPHCHGEGQLTAALPRPPPRAAVARVRPVAAVANRPRTDLSGVRADAAATAAQARASPRLAPVYSQDGMHTVYIHVRPTCAGCAISHTPRAPSPSWCTHMMYVPRRRHWSDQAFRTTGRTPDCAFAMNAIACSSPWRRHHLCHHTPPLFASPVAVNSVAFSPLRAPQPHSSRGVRATMRDAAVLSVNEREFVVRARPVAASHCLSPLTPTAVILALRRCKKKRVWTAGVRWRAGS